MRETVEKARELLSKVFQFQNELERLFTVVFEHMLREEEFDFEMYQDVRVMAEINGDEEVFLASHEEPTEF